MQRAHLNVVQGHTEHRAPREDVILLGLEREASPSGTASRHLLTCHSHKPGCNCWCQKDTACDFALRVGENSVDVIAHD